MANKRAKSLICSYSSIMRVELMDDIARRMFSVGILSNLNLVSIRYPEWEFIIYTGDVESPPDLILKNAKERFNISLERGVTFVYLRTRFLVEAQMYPVFTLLGQSIGSVILGLEALFRFLPGKMLFTVML